MITHLKAFVYLYILPSYKKQLLMNFLFVHFTILSKYLLCQYLQHSRKSSEEFWCCNVQPKGCITEWKHRLHRTIDVANYREPHHNLVCLGTWQELGKEVWRNLRARKHKSIWKGTEGTTTLRKGNYITKYRTVYVYFQSPSIIITQMHPMMTIFPPSS